MFYVYALYAPNYDKIYIGFTSNLDQRLIDHNHRAKKGWTIKFRSRVFICKKELLHSAFNILPITTTLKSTPLKNTHEIRK